LQLSCKRAASSVLLGPVCSVRSTNSVAQGKCSMYSVQSLKCSVCTVQMLCKLFICVVFLCPVCIVHKLCTITSQCTICVQPVRCAMLSALGVHCVNVAQFTVRSVFLCPGCPNSVHKLYTVPHPYAMCVLLVKCAMLSVSGVHCANRVRIAVCNAFLGPGCLVHITMQCVCSLSGVNSPRQVQNAARRPRLSPPAFLLCAMLVAHCVCALPTRDGARRGS